MARVTVKESIIPKPTSPVTAGWDNPFPTFPSSRPKPRQTEDRTLSNSVAEKNIHEVVRESESPRGSQNRGSNNKGSQSSSRGQESRNNRVGLGPRNRQRRDPRSNGNHPEIPQHGKAETQRTVRRVAQPSVNLLRTGLAYDDRSVAQVHDNGRRQHQDSHFDPAYIAPPLPSNTAVDMGSQRSMTMPNEFTEVKLEPKPHQRYPDPLEWQEPGPTGGYYGPESQIIIPQRPATSSGSRPTVSAHPWPDEATRSYGNGAESAAIHDDMKIHVKQESLSDFFDSYYDVTPGGSSARANGFEHRPSLEEEMPNFDAVPVTRPAHSRDMTIEQHLQPRESVPNVPSMPAYALDSPEWHHNSSFAGQAAWSKSQPDYGGRSQPQSGNDAGFVFELAGDVPAAPQIPSHFDSRAQHNHDRNGDVKSKGQYNDQSAQRSEGGAWSAIQAYKGVGEDNDRTQSGRQRQVQHHSLSPYNPQLELPVPRANFEQRTGGSEISLSPINQSVSTHQPMVRPGNPDALPEHPTPVRLGLMPGSMANQAPKPPPIRQYNSSASPIQQSGPTSQPVASRPSQEKRVFAPVTLDELERLKRIIKTNPTDQKTQLILAKKWVEAASVLADEGGRADPKTRNKNRERYILDAHKIIKKLVSSGNPDAMFYLADCHGRGLLGLETDNKEAFTLYQSAAKVGHAQSAYRVAVCCEMGHEQGGGTRRDPLKAMQWYKRAAMLGDTPAMYKMGMILLKGLLGQPKHPREAIVWLKRAADLADEENPHALHELVAVPPPVYTVLS